MGTVKLDVSLMFPNSVLHRSSSLTDVDFIAFTGIPGNAGRTASFSRTRCDLNVVSELKNSPYVLLQAAAKLFG